LPGRVLVMLTAYADESVAQPGSGSKNSFSISAFGGYVASVEEWQQFSVRWQRVLNNYDAEAFHFREWALAASVAKKKRSAPSSFHKNPYCGWKETKLTAFLYDLAGIAGTRKYGSFGGFISLERFTERQAAGEILIGEDHRDFCLKGCFQAFIDALNTEGSNRIEPVSFIWDGTKDASWKKSITDAYEPFRRRNPTFASISFADDKFCLPLQAADMVSYRIRQKTDSRFRGEPSSASHLDKLLFGDGTEGRLGFFNIQ